MAEIMKRCVIVCASPDAQPDFVKTQIRPDDYVIAADGGLSILQKIGLEPSLFVGDFDSFNALPSGSFEICALNTHKDDTDSMHCAELAVEKQFKEVVLLAATGGRLDHTFSNYCVLSFLESKGVNAVMLSEREEVRFLPRGEFVFEGKQNTTFSVFPFGCDSAVVSYIGDVEYPAAETELHFSSSLGISNIFRSEVVRVLVHSGSVLLFNSFKKL